MTGRHAASINALACFLLISLLSATLTEPVGSQENPAERRAREVVELINGGDEAAIREYIEESFAPSFRDAFPMEMHLGAFAGVRRDFGEVVIEQVSSTEENGEALARSVSGNRQLRIVVWVEPSEPYRITSLGFREVEEEPEQSDRPASDPIRPEVAEDVPASTWEQLDADLRASAGRNEFSGTVLVTRHGEPVFQNAYGLASKNYGVPNRLSTRFNLGSLNKMFTSIAIAQLAQRGELELDDLIGEHLTGFSAEAANRVTIRHLLQMRSGWGDYWNNETYTQTWRNLRTVSDYISFLKDLPLQFEPGTQAIHSNTSFQVLGAVIEAVSGRDYFEYIKEYVFTPAGMHDSDPWGARDAPGENIATGYTNLNPFDPDGVGFRWSNIYFIAATGTPAGGGYSTAGDLAAFASALRNHVLLDETNTDLWFRNFDASHSISLLRYAGGAMGVSTSFNVDLSGGYTIVVLSNYDMPVATGVARLIMERLGLL